MVNDPNFADRRRSFGGLGELADLYVVRALSTASKRDAVLPYASATPLLCSPLSLIPLASIFLVNFWSLITLKDLFKF